MEPAVTLVVLALAFFNGANDNMKGVATVWGTGLLSYRGALLLATAATAIGSLLSVAVSAALVDVFAAHAWLPAAVRGPQLMLAAGGGAVVALGVATVLGLPISTTHALLGGLAGAAVAAAPGAVDWRELTATAAAPLAFSPVVAVALAIAVTRLGRAARRRLRVEAVECVCIGAQWVPVSASGAATVLARSAVAVPSAGIGSWSECRRRYLGSVLGIPAQRLVDVTHLVSAAAVSFARGLNDTPKLVGLLVGAALSVGTATPVVAVAMAAGGLAAGGRVGRTMATGIASLATGTGTAGNLVTSLLVIGASRLGLPVSTTHVSASAIAGAGAASRSLRGPVFSRIVLSWVLTLPIAGLAAMLAYGVLR